MSKYIISAGKYYKTKSTCPLCNSIDKIFKNLSTLNINDIYTQKQIDILEDMLVNGFDLDNVYISNGVNYDKIKDNLISNNIYNDDYLNSVYKTLNWDYDTEFNESKALQPTMSFSRYCKECGARKHDIFNTETFQSFNNLSFTANLVKPHCHLTFTEENFQNGDNFKIYRKDDTDYNYITDITPTTYYDDFGATSTSQYIMTYVEQIYPDVERSGTDLNITWSINGTNAQLYRSIKGKDEFVILDINNTTGAYTDTNVPIKTKYEYKLIYTATLNIPSEYKPTAIHLQWDNLPNYHPPYTYTISKQPSDNEHEYQFVINLPQEQTEYYDYDINDNMIYYYKLNYINEMNHSMYSLTTDEIYPLNINHTPQNLTNLHFIKHKYLDDNLNTQEYVYAQYDLDKLDGEDVWFKINEQHVPSLKKWYQDITFWNNEPYYFTNKETVYFLKPYIRSRLFKQNATNNTGYYKDNYYWYINSPSYEFYYEAYRDDIYNITFDASQYRTMIINYSLKIKNKIKFVYLVFKQIQSDNEWIKNDDFETYKVFNIPVYTALYDYQITINNLLSNSYYVFGVFPVYEDADPDIRLEYQNISKILPYWKEWVTFENPEDFYDIGKWYKSHDFNDYNHTTKNKIITTDARDKKVWMCDNLEQKECSPLLIHQHIISEWFTLTFDYKMIAKTLKDRLHHFIIDDLYLRISNTYDKWFSAHGEFYNRNCAIIRWEQMKLASMPWTCTFIDNIIIHNHQTIDDKVDNYTRQDVIKLKNVYYYNRTIKHNAVHQHTSDKFYDVQININPYYDEKDTFESEDFVADTNGVINVYRMDENLEFEP